MTGKIVEVQLKVISAINLRLTLQKSQWDLPLYFYFNQLIQGKFYSH